MPQVAEPFPSYLLVVLGVAVAAIVVVAVLLIKHRKK
jgi:hypothetical protein